MRFMIIVKATKNSEAGVLPSEKLIAEMAKYNEELAKAGMLLVGEGLQASSKGARRDRVSISAVFVLQFSREGLQTGRKRRQAQPLNLTQTRRATMRFMMLMIPKGYETAEPGTMPDPKAVETMMKYNEDLQKAGVLVSLDGLHPPSMGARVSFKGGKPAVTDGPFTEAKEVLGGYWMIRVKSKEEAIEWAKRCPASDNEVIELRQVQELEDFPADVQKAAAGFQEMQARSGQR